MLLDMQNLTASVTAIAEAVLYLSDVFHLLRNFMHTNAFCRLTFASNLGQTKEKYMCSLLMEYTFLTQHFFEFEGLT